MNKPALIEPGVKYFIGETLKNCNKNKYEYYNKLFNLILFLLFFSILAITIYFSYVSKKTNIDKSLQNQQKQEYILNMVQKIHDNQLKKHGDKITNLPEFESEFEITMKKFL